MHSIKQFVLERKKILIRAVSVLLPMVALVALLSQTASAKTYVINDGGRILVHTTTATDPEDVLGEAGLELDADDTYTTQAIIGFSEINVQRSLAVTVDYFGEIIETESGGETVKKLLKRLNLSWDSDDTVSHPLDAEVYDGMELSVAHIVRENQTYTAALDYKTTYCKDADLPSGTQEVLTEGIEGEVVCEAAVTYINGVETERTVLSERVIRQPVNEVIAVGCAEVPEEEAETEEEPITYTVEGNTITLSTGEVLTFTDIRTFRASAYTHTDAGCDMITATGTRVKWGTVAVDPRKVPYGTRMFIVTNDGSYVYGVATAEDCGGAIKGNRLDLYMPSYSECMAFGRKTCTVYILG